MQRLSRIVLIAVLATIASAGLVSTASASHNGNNKAELKGTGDPDALGNAVVNYREGTGTFNARTTVRNLDPFGMYSFFVSGAGAGDGVLICSGTANEQGQFTCSDQDRALPGFTTAVIRDEEGNEVARGTFARRGNCRDPEQAGSQCEAAGRRR